MKCRYITKRSKKYEIYLYCRFSKKKIEMKECYDCCNGEQKKYKQIKKKSSKLTKIEKERLSILTDDMKHCYICGKEKKHIHEIYGGRNRQISMKNGFVIPICEICHSKTETDMDFDKKLKRECQMKFEEKNTRYEFLKLIDKNYLN